MATRDEFLKAQEKLAQMHQQMQARQQARVDAPAVSLEGQATVPPPQAAEPQGATTPELTWQDQLLAVMREGWEGTVLHKPVSESAQEIGQLTLSFYAELIQMGLVAGSDLEELEEAAENGDEMALLMGIVALTPRAPQIGADAASFLVQQVNGHAEQVTGGFAGHLNQIAHSHDGPLWEALRDENCAKQAAVMLMHDALVRAMVSFESGMVYRCLPGKTRIEDEGLAFDAGRIAPMAHAGLHAIVEEVGGQHLLLGWRDGMNHDGETARVMRETRGDMASVGPAGSLVYNEILSLVPVPVQTDAPEADDREEEGEGELSLEAMAKMMQMMVRKPDGTELSDEEALDMAAKVHAMQQSGPQQSEEEAREALERAMAKQVGNEDEDGPSHPALGAMNRMQILAGAARGARDAEKFAEGFRALLYAATQINSFPGPQALPEDLAEDFNLLATVERVQLELCKLMGEVALSVADKVGEGEEHSHLRLWNLALGPHMDAYQGLISQNLLNLAQLCDHPLLNAMADEEEELEYDAGDRHGRAENHRVAAGLMLTSAQARMGCMLRSGRFESVAGFAQTQPGKLDWMRMAMAMNSEVEPFAAMDVFVEGRQDDEPRLKLGGWRSGKGEVSVALFANSVGNRDSAEDSAISLSAITNALNQGIYPLRPGESLAQTADVFFPPMF